jgi:hypothetical protein
LQLLRTIEVLERINNEASVKLLKELASGAVGARITDAAQMALERIEMN